MKPTLPSIIALIGLGCASAQAATVIDFSGTQYADNFTETANGANLNIDSVNGTLRMNHGSSLAGIATYNTVFPSATNTDDFSLKIDGKFTGLSPTLGGDSVGFMTNINGVTGYLVVFRINATGADVRLFEGATTTGSTVGTQREIRTASGTFSSDTFYTFSLEVNAIEGTSISFTASILDATNGNVLAAFTTMTDNSPSFGGTANQVALRLGTNGTITNYTTVDNFVLTAIPEPASFALLGGLGALGLVATRRRRR